MIGASRVVTHLGAHGAETVKPIEIKTTLGHEAHLPLVRNKTQAFKRLGKYAELRPPKKVKKTSSGAKRKDYGWSKRGWVSGALDRRQKASSQYPSEFAGVVARVVGDGMLAEAGSAIRLPAARG
eukprot:5731428-Pyramimonas_sp.AAC.1